MLASRSGAHRLVLVVLVALAAALPFAAAPAANAGLNSWTGLGGFSSTSDGPWVREYVMGSPPSTTMYAATEGSGVWKSTNVGVTWTDISAGLTGGAKNVRTVYLDGSTVYAGTSSGLFKSTGGSFSPVAQGAGAGKLNKAVQAVLKTTGGPLLAGVASGGVYRSTDGGSTWTPPAAGNGMAASETVWGLTSFASNPAVIFAATGSGIYRSTNGGATWTLASDGISGTTRRVIADGANPNIYYAVTFGNGVFRTITAGGIPGVGAGWSHINGAGTDALGELRTYDLVQTQGVATTRLYVATYDGLWAGTTGSGAVPGDTSWRHVDPPGLPVAGEVFWTIARFTGVPGTFYAGSQGAGGYAMTMTPPLNIVDPSVAGSVQRSKTVTAANGTWSGTPEIEFEYQWQTCTANDPNTCSDIAGADEQSYVIPANANTTHRLRVVVTASNDVPTFGLAVEESALTGTIAANAGTLPGSTNSSAVVSYTAVAPGDASLPQVGDTITAGSHLFNPAATNTGWRWHSCTDTNFATCELAQSTGSANTYMLKPGDVGRRICVQVVGSDVDGSTTLPCAGWTNTVLAPDPQQLAAPVLNGSAIVGQSLVATAGTWAWPGSTFARRWLRCAADGSSCSTITGATASSYKLAIDDLGHRLKVEVTVDSNGSNTFPSPVSVYTGLSAVVKNPPDVTKPKLFTLGFQAATVKKGAKFRLKWAMNEQARFVVRVHTMRKGRKQNGICKVSNQTGTPCIVFVPRGSILVTKQPKVGSRLLGPGVSGKVLQPGKYRFTVTPIDPSGNIGLPKVAVLTVTKP